MSEFFRAILTGRGKIRSFFVLVLMLKIAALPSTAQWTEPVPIDPQPGAGVRAPWLSNDGLRLYVSSSSTLHVIERDSVGSPWGTWRLLPPHLMITNTQQCPCESPSGDTLYFLSDPRPDCENYGLWDIYYSIMTDTGWGPVFSAGPNVNSNRYEYSVGISRDGQTLLVSSRRLGTFGADIFFHEKQQNGTWGEPIHLPSTVNEFNWSEEHPSLSPDGNRLFFLRGELNLGDIMESRKVDGAWQTAFSLPSPINSQFTREEDPCLDMDGRTLWFLKAPTDSGGFLLLSSIDTTVLSSPTPRRIKAGEPELQVTTDSVGRFLLRLHRMPLAGEFQVTVYSILGQELLRQNSSFEIQGGDMTSSIQIDDLPSGLYILSVEVPNKILTAQINFIK